MLRHVVLSLLVTTPALAQLQCNVPNNDKVDCGYFGIQQPECEASGCCWVPVSKDGEAKDTPWCFYQEGTTRPPSVCDNIIWTGAGDYGFTQQFYDLGWGA